MRIYRVLPALLTVLAACGDGGGGAREPDGPPTLRVVSGDRQSTSALRDSLGAPAGVQLYRRPNGPGVIADLFTVAELHAQTSVRGIPGQVLNAVPLEPNGLIPWNASAVTDTAGIARFYFNPGTKAGESCAELRTVVDGLPVIPDTVCAMVSAGPVWDRFDSGTASPTYSFPHTVRFDAVTDRYGNAVPFRLVARAPITVAADHRTVGYAGTVTGQAQLFSVIVTDTAGTRIGGLRITVYGDGSLGWRAVGTTIADSLGI